MIFPALKLSDYSSTYEELSSNYEKIYGEASNSFDKLLSTFNPYATHILNFIKYWCENDVSYGYEIICTRRSWFSQKKVTTIYDDEKNGLSWYLYGNAISINVFKKVPNQLFDGGSLEDVVHESLNFSDGSAKKFIIAAQEWFINNPLIINGTSRIVKIFGIYPNIKECINTPVSELFLKYKNDEDVVYWGGLFSGFSNFSHWEWHPGYQPNEVWKRRETFLNMAFSGIDLVNLLSDESQTTNYHVKFLKNYKEIIEEDFLSLIKLKIKINLSKEYSILDMINWANNNPLSLNQMITYYYIVGDYNLKSLFEILKLIASTATISYNESNEISLSASNLLNVVYSNTGNYVFEYYNEFGEKITLEGDYTLTLPVDSKIMDEDFDIVDLDIDDNMRSMYSDTLTDIAMDKVVSDINSNSTQNQNILFDINEHGMLGDISIMPEKVLTIDELQKTSTHRYIFEEMITPPNQIIKNTNKKSKAIDISNISLKSEIFNNTVDEMVNPEKLT